MVDLDDGHVSVPSTVVLQHLPGQLKEVVEEALAEVMHPSIKQRDYVFNKTSKKADHLRYRQAIVVTVALIVLGIQKCVYVTSETTLTVYCVQYE